MNKLLEALEAEGAEVKNSIKRMVCTEDEYVGYLDQFMECENLAKLKEAVEMKDAKAAEFHSHTLKGMASNLGFLSLMDVCSDMVTDIREGNPEEAYEYLEDVEEAYNEWADIIKENR